MVAIRLNALCDEYLFTNLLDSLSVATPLGVKVYTDNVKLLKDSLTFINNMINYDYND